MGKQKGKGACIRMGGRELRLRLNMAALEDIEAQYGTLGGLIDAMANGERALEAMYDALAILSNGEMQAQGKDPDLTAAWIRCWMRPGQLGAAQAAIQAAIAEGMRMEEGDADEDGPVDVVLEEIEAKKNSAQ